MADTLSQDSTLDLNQAGAAFAELLDPPKPDPVDTPVVDTEIDAAVTAEPEDTQAEIEDEIKMVPVVVNGKTVEVPLSEVLASYQKDKAATERFEAASALKKEASAETQRAQQERATYAANLERMGLQLEAVLQSHAGVDWEALAKSDPAEWVVQRNLAEKQQTQLNQINQQRAQIHQQMQAERAAAHQSYMQEQSQALLAKLPTWADESKANAERAALKAYLIKEGYDEAAIGGISDHKAVILARKAMLYDQTIAKAVAASKKVATLPQKVERPGVADTPVMDKRSAAFQRLSKSGRVEDAAALFSALL